MTEDRLAGLEARVLQLEEALMNSDPMVEVCQECWDGEEYTIAARGRHGWKCFACGKEIPNQNWRLLAVIRKSWLSRSAPEN